MEKENSNPPMDHQSKEEAIIHDPMAADVVEVAVERIYTLPTPKFMDTSKAEAAVLDVASTSVDVAETDTQSAIFCDEFAMDKENSNPLSKETEEAVKRSLPTPKFVDTSKEEAVVRHAASTSADTVETGTQNAMTFSDEVDDEDDDWIQRIQIQPEALTAPPPLDVVPVVDPWLELLMTAPPEAAALLRASRAARTNVFNVGSPVNAYNQHAAEARTEASATVRPSAPVLNSIRAARRPRTRRTNIFNVAGAHVNAYNNQHAAEARTEASATARPSAPVVYSIRAGRMNIFDVGDHVNAYNNQHAAEARTEASSATARPSAPVVNSIRAARTNIFNVGAHVNACNHHQHAAEPRPSAPVVNSTIFEGSTEEEDGNDWYDSIAYGAQRLEQMEEPEIQEMPSPLRLSEAPPKEEEEHCSQKRPSAGEDDGRELTLEDYCKIWGLHPSELDPDEPGPSSTTKRQSRVPPLADDEVAKFDCGICLETLPILDLFHGMQCDHKFCAQCMATYIEGRIRDGGVPILCPDPACKEAAGEAGNDGGVLNPEHCKKSIDFAAFCTWGDRLTERAIPPDQRVYCPNPRCGLMLERTSGDDKRAPCKASCPACNHLMCTACGLGWVIDGRDDDHHNCDEGKGAALVKELAAARRWKQCPSCKIMVERIMGCDTMHCRCGCLFCYSCGRPMDAAGQDGGAELCQCRQNQNVYHLNVPRRQLGAHARAQAILNRYRQRPRSN